MWSNTPRVKDISACRFLKTLLFVIGVSGSLGKFAPKLYRR